MRPLQAKAQKKTSALPADDSSLKQALVTLEDACMRVMDMRFLRSDDDDIDSLYMQQRFKNIVTPVSLALAECRGGPRRFHHHYRHSAADASVLQPVMENPVETLAHACQDALLACQTKLVGLRNADMFRTARNLEHALQYFLTRCRKY